METTLDDHQRRAARPGAGVLAALAALFLVGLGIRLLGVDFCLPHMREMDSEIVTQVSHLRGKPLRTRTNRIFYATYPMLTAACTWLGTSPPVPEVPPAEASLEEHLERAGDDYEDTRRTVAVLSSLLVPVTWLLARRFVGPRWGLYAAGLACFSLLHVFFSQEARPHGPTAVCFVLTMLACFRVRARPTWGSYALAGLALALLLGFLHSGIAMGIPFVVAHWLREPQARAGGPAGWRRLIDPRLLATGGILLASIPATYWPMIDPSLKDVESAVDEDVVAMPGHVVKWSRFNGGGFETTIDTMRSYEPMLGLLALLALCVFVATRIWPSIPEPDEPIGAARTARDRDAWIVLAFVLPYAFMISLWEENYERFVIPLLPFLATFVAWSGRELARRFAARIGDGAGRIVTVGLVACLALPATASARLAWLRHRPDTIELATEWITTHLEPGADRIFLTPWWDLPLARTDETLNEKLAGRAFHVVSTWKQYQARQDQPLPEPRWPITTMVVLKEYDGQTVEGLRAYLDFFGPGYYVVDAKKRGHPWMRWMTDELASRGTRLARFSPDGPDGRWTYPLFDQDGVAEDWPDLTPRVLRAVAVGPVVEIYRVD